MFVSEHIPGTDYFLAWRDSVFVEGENPKPGQTVSYAYQTTVGGRECPRNTGVYKMGGAQRKPALELLFSRMTVGSIFEVGLRAGAGTGLLEACGPVPEDPPLTAIVEMLKVR